MAAQDFTLRPHGGFGRWKGALGVGTDVTSLFCRIGTKVADNRGLTEWCGSWAASSARFGLDAWLTGWSTTHMTSEAAAGTGVGISLQFASGDARGDRFG